VCVCVTCRLTNILLLSVYHHQNAKAVYNLIRVFVSAYVWMTGFNNFSFFYIRGDYSFSRFAQMIWRLNFLVLALMLVMGTTYILYYIVPVTRARSPASRSRVSFSFTRFIF
jgi:hypothetical protein